MFKVLKWGVVGVGVLVVGGLLFFGKDVFSYASSSRKLLASSVKEAIPVQFEIQRARDLLEELIPEMHANLRTVAQEEVEVAALEKEVAAEREAVTSERTHVRELRRRLDTIPTAAEPSPSQREMLEDLSQRFERFRTQEMLLAGKEKLLQNRRTSLHAAIQKLEKTRLARVELASQIEALEGQFRLIQTQGAASDLRLDTTKLAQTQKFLADLRKRLEVAQRVLERESRLSDPFPARSVTAQGLAEDIDRHFEKHRGSSATAPVSAGGEATALASPQSR